MKDAFENKQIKASGPPSLGRWEEGLSSLTTLLADVTETHDACRPRNAMFTHYRIKQRADHLGVPSVHILTNCWASVENTVASPINRKILQIWAPLPTGLVLTLSSLRLHKQHLGETGAQHSITGAVSQTENQDSSNWPLLGGHKGSARTGQPPPSPERHGKQKEKIDYFSARHFFFTKFIHRSSESSHM